VTGNLGGQINILIPIALFGIVQVNAHQGKWIKFEYFLIFCLQLASGWLSPLTRARMGAQSFAWSAVSFKIQSYFHTVLIDVMIDGFPMPGAASIGYVDVYIQNGGLIGDIANSQFRARPPLSCPFLRHFIVI
jgi:hypothetical protein